MPSWAQLEQDIGNWLGAFANDSILFRNSFQAIPGFPYDGFRSDGLLATDDTLIAIEIEASQEHPDTNVGKYWLLYDEFKKYKKIILFHIYTPAFNSYGWRLRLGKFYAEKMESVMPLEYIFLDYRSRQLHEYADVLAEIKEKVLDIIQREFGIAAAQV